MVDGPCIGPPNILRSGVVGWARKHEQSKKLVVVKEFCSEIMVFLVKKGSYTLYMYDILHSTNTENLKRESKNQKNQADD